MLVKERLEKQVQGCLFVEEVSNSYAGFKVTVITKDSIEWIKKELSDEYKLVQSFGTYLLGSNSVDTLIHHWAKGRIYQRNKGMSVSKKTYPVRDAINLLKSYNQSHINHPKDCLKLIEFAMSLVEKKTKVITFGMDTESLKFLLLPSEYSNSISYYNKLNNSEAKSKFVKALIDTFYSMGVKYVPVVITDGFRTMDEQAERVNKRGCPYYMDKVKSGSDSYPYLETLKKIYDDHLDMETVLSTAQIEAGAKEEIRKHKGDLLATLKALINEYFNPSKHTIGQSLDIRIHGNHKATAEAIKDMIKGYTSNDHIHLNLD